MHPVYPLFIGGVGPLEILLVFAVIVLLFGAERLPDLANAAGRSMGEFQQAREEVEREIRAAQAADVVSPTVDPSSSERLSE
jgi:sec-independent protein translocase protein TatA